MASRDIFDVWWQKIAPRLDTQAIGQCWLWTGPATGKYTAVYGKIRIRKPGSIVSVQ